jgi:U3 small nucleolar RNA-associated protein 10
MATALQAQLAQIAARSSNPLNLKAQRELYAKSLLYEPEVAAGQDLDTLYDVCVEGYRELCGIDRRFETFGRTIFSEQSKRENRLQMTSAQNTELDGVLESFMGLLAARLLLKPAVKALEWLIRQFR